MKLLFLDLDGTVRRPKSGAKFITNPEDQELIPGVKDAINRYPDWKIIGITNQGGVAMGYKSLDECIQEQCITLQQIPQLKKIYFCPDIEGKDCWLVSLSNWIGVKAVKISGSKPIASSYRKPGHGMIEEAMYNRPIEETLMVGDQEEDRQCALSAGIPFQWAEDWRKQCASSTGQSRSIHA